MPRFCDKKILPYSPEEMFALVADVAAYPEFLPWCRAARLFEQTETTFKADLIIGFMAFKEKFTSFVKLDAPHTIEVDYIEGPMKRLYNHWRFIPHEKGCIIDFEVDLEFKSALLEKLIGAKFEDATYTLVNAFEKRAIELYGVR